MSVNASNIYRIPRISCHEYLENKNMMKAENLLLLDVREEDEWLDGHIKAATHIALSQLESKVSAKIPDHKQPVLVYCLHGSRSKQAAAFLLESGYEDVSILEGGYMQFSSEYPSEIT